MENNILRNTNVESKTIIATLKGQVGKLLDDNRMLRAELKKLVAEQIGRAHV